MGLRGLNELIYESTCLKSLTSSSGLTNAHFLPSICY